MHVLKKRSERDLQVLLPPVIIVSFPVPYLLMISFQKQALLEHNTNYTAETENAYTVQHS